MRAFLILILSLCFFIFVTGCQNQRIDTIEEVQSALLGKWYLEKENEISLHMEHADTVLLQFTKDSSFSEGFKWENPGKWAYHITKQSCNDTYRLFIGSGFYLNETKTLKGRLYTSCILIYSITADKLTLIVDNHEWDHSQKPMAWYYKKIN